jgi:hypothetical protein
MWPDTTAYLASVHAALDALAGKVRAMHEARVTDRDYFALTLYGEARGEAVAGRVAVACVLRNRLRTGRWGMTYEAVCTARKQFSCWNVTDPNRAILFALAENVAAKLPIQAVLRECYAIADVFLAEDTIRLVGNATHYYAPAAMVPKNRVPTWAVGEPLARIGGHLFFLV